MKWFVSIVICLLVGLGTYILWERQSHYFESSDFALSYSQGRINGHDYVDLGLPSGLKWATCNVGASRPEDYGNYYAWGEIQTKSEYTEENSLTYGKDIGNISGNSRYDVARAQWGSSWRLPTFVEIKELKDKCKWEWITIGSNKGYRVTGPNGNSIFLPAAGCYYGLECLQNSDGGYYWSGTRGSMHSDEAYILEFDNDYPEWKWGYDWGGDSSLEFGLSVRPVSE